MKNLNLKLPDEDDYYNAQLRNKPPLTTPFEGFKAGEPEQPFSEESFGTKTWLFLSPNLNHWKEQTKPLTVTPEAVKWQNFDFVATPNANVPEAITAVATPLREKIKEQRHKIRDDMNL